MSTTVQLVMAISPENWIDRFANPVQEANVLVWPISSLQLLKFPETGHVPAVGDFQG